MRGDLHIGGVMIQLVDSLGKSGYSQGVGGRVGCEGEES